MTHAAKQAGNADDLKESVVAVKDAVVDMATEGARYARDRVSDARDAAAAGIDAVKSKAGDCNDSVVGYVRKNPYKSLAIAAGIGFAASYLLRRRD